MEPQTYPDPFGDALHHGLQRAVQIASSAVTGVQVLLYLQRNHARALAEQHDKARRALETQARADRAAARARWAAAVDPEWTRNADLAGAAAAWGAAMPYADAAAPWHEPTAATAMRRCEERLRVLHPSAMARYDRLRAEGATPGDAMREAAPLFGYPPQTREGQYYPKLALAADQHASPGVTSVPPPPGPAMASPTPGPAMASPTPGPAKSAAQPWRLDFPMPISDVVATAATTPAAPAAPAARTPAAQPTLPAAPQP